MDPFLEDQDLLRIGGGSLDCRSGLDQILVIILGCCHDDKLLVRHQHDRVKDQGCIFRETPLPNAGYWIVGVRKCINSISS